MRPHTAVVHINICLPIAFNVREDSTASSSSHSSREINTHKLARTHATMMWPLHHCLCDPQQYLQHLLPAEHNRVTNAVEPSRKTLDELVRNTYTRWVHEDTVGLSKGRDKVRLMVKGCDEGSAIKPGLSCRIHFLYTLITFLVADASQDGSRKA
ncbi:hypothetical protein EYF80_006706 [Liparis tanakae]|uniref:Uncharacterized protein n=1 Tax=Liparis tanakae TaxID=230148 RepID=A0A4Z2IYN9_9TELE|nr:hypothetical protein EYF80_006706 [Liparis tanakae]